MQLGLGLAMEQDFESVTDVLGDLMRGSCNRCQLSLLHPKNRGFMYRGNPNAKIVVLDLAPGDTETNQGLPLTGHAGSEFEKWMRYLKLDTRNDVFITQVVHCQPPKKATKDGRYEQVDPDRDAVKACWYPRTVRLLKAMPNLECVITLGFSAAGIMLGGDAISKTHEGRWFVSSLLPGIPVFCLAHPDSLIGGDPSPDKKGKVRNCLDCFQREYLQTRKVVQIAKDTVIPSN